VTLGGRLLHARAAVTRNERLPIVRSRVRGMLIVCKCVCHLSNKELLYFTLLYDQSLARAETQKRRRCSASASSVQRRSRARYGGAMKRPVGDVFSLEPATSASHEADEWRGRTSTRDRQGAQLHWERTGAGSAGGQEHQTGLRCVVESRPYPWRNQWLILTYLLFCIISKLWLIVKFSLATGERLSLTPSLGSSPANLRINFTSPETIIVLPDAKNRTIISLFLWRKHRNVTDRHWQPVTITVVCVAVKNLTKLRKCSTAQRHTHTCHKYKKLLMFVCNGPSFNF